MVLTIKDGRAFVLRGLLFASMLAGALMLGACGSSEQTASEEEGFEDSTATAQQPTAEAPKEESGDQQALTSFIGAAPKKEQKEEKKEEPPVAQAQPTPTPAPANTVDDLRTENTSLKQQVVKLEQDTRSLNARISDAEAKYMAEKERADKAEEAAKVAAQSAAISARGGEVTSEPVSGDVIAVYKNALQTFRSRNYESAISKLQSMLDGGVPKNLEDNCHYWMGEANFGKKNYNEALKHFEQVFQYSKSEKLADAQYMMAQCYERMGNKVKAKEEYERVVKDFPTSNNVKKARARWARL